MNSLYILDSRALLVESLAEIPSSEWLLFFLYLWPLLMYRSFAFNVIDDVSSFHFFIFVMVVNFMHRFGFSFSFQDSKSFVFLSKLEGQG